MRWVIITGMYNVADLATEFCSYHLDLGVDKIFVGEYGSDDGTMELLTPFVREGVVQVVPLPTHRLVEYDPSNALLDRVRKENSGDWVSFLDPDEFLVGPPELKRSLDRLWLDGPAAIKVPRANLTCIGPIPETGHYLKRLNLKIVATDIRIPSASALLCSPWIFSRLPPKVMLRASRPHLSVTAGDHDVLGTEEEPATSSFLEILHLPVRSYAAFKGKIEAGMQYFEKNPELGPGIGWHWRRWITLLQSERLREEYHRQFLDASAAESLLAEGQIVSETRLADWLVNKRRIHL